MSDKNEAEHSSEPEVELTSPDAALEGAADDAWASPPPARGKVSRTALMLAAQMRRPRPAAAERSSASRKERPASRRRKAERNSINKAIAQKRGVPFDDEAVAVRVGGDDVSETVRPPVAAEAAPSRPAKSTPATPADDPRGLGATIRDRARTVRAAELARQHEEVRVLNLSTIMGLVEEAVSEALEHSEHRLEEGEKRRLLEEAEEEFQERLEAYKAEKAGLESQTQVLEEQLERAQELLEEERAREVSADRFTVSDAGIVELEKRMHRLLDRVVKKASVTTELEDEMRAVVSQLLDDEREKIRLQAEEAQSDSISLLERKVQRLSQNLEEADLARRRAESRANALAAQQGNFTFQNIYEVGLDDEDPDYQLKLELLREIVEGNHEVRKFMKETGREVVARQRPQMDDSEPRESSPDADDTELIGCTHELEEAVRASESAVDPEAQRPADAEAFGDEDVSSEEIAVTDSRGIKTIQVKRVKPPPLESVKPASEAVDSSALDEATEAFLNTSEEDGAEIDPDDQLWEPAADPVESRSS